MADSGRSVLEETSTLPGQVTRLLLVLRELDHQYQTISQELETKRKCILQEIYASSDPLSLMNTERTHDIDRLSQKSKSLIKEKVAMETQLLFMVKWERERLAKEFSRHHRETSDDTDLNHHESSTSDIQNLPYQNYMGNTVHSNMTSNTPPHEDRSYSGTSDLRYRYKNHTSAIPPHDSKEPRRHYRMNQFENDYLKTLDMQQNSTISQSSNVPLMNDLNYGYKSDVSGTSSIPDRRNQKKIKKDLNAYKPHGNTQVSPYFGVDPTASNTSITAASDTSSQFSADATSMQNSFYNSHPTIHRGPGGGMHPIASHSVQASKYGALRGQVNAVKSSQATVPTKKGTHHSLSDPFLSAHNARSEIETPTPTKWSHNEDKHQKDSRLMTWGVSSAPYDNAHVDTTLGDEDLGDGICPVCQKGESEANHMMVGCDACNNWFHFECVNYSSTGREEASWFCPQCISNGLVPRIETSQTSKSSRSRRR